MREEMTNDEWVGLTFALATYLRIRGGGKESAVQINVICFKNKDKVVSPIINVRLHREFSHTIPNITFK